MRLPRLRITVRRMMALVAVVAVLLWAVMTSPRAWYYHQQARIQAQLEASEQQEEQKARSDPSERVFGTPEDDIRWHAEEAANHARLKDQYRWLVWHPWADGPPNSPQSPLWNRERDRAVLELALADLTDPRNPHNAVMFGKTVGPGAEFVVSETTYPYWYGMDRGDETLTAGPTAEAWADLRRRHSEGPEILSSLSLGGAVKIRYDDPERIYLAADDQNMDFSEYFQALYPRACGYVWAELPGYSRDGRRAVASFSGGFGGHPIYWTYEFEATRSGWKIRRRAQDFGE